MNFSISVKGDEQAARKLQRIGHNAGRAHPILSDLVDELLTIQRERYASNQGMKKEAASTLKTDRRQGRDTRPLRDTGALMNSVTRRNAPHQILTIRDNYLSLGTNLHYARFHQDGKGVPKRKVINVTPRQRKRLAQMVLNHIVED